jgi:hypothetical protein
VTTIALLAIAPRKEPVRVWFVRFTNSAGFKLLVSQGSNGIPIHTIRPAGYEQLVFEGMNGLSRQIEFSASVFTGAIPQAKAPVGSRTIYDWTMEYPAAGRSFSFTLDAPSNDVPYYVVWEFHDNTRALTRWGRFRMGCYNFFRTRGMYWLAGRFIPKTKAHYIPSTELKE